MKHMSITERYHAAQQNNKTELEDTKMFQNGNILIRHSSNISETVLYEESLSDIAIESSNNTSGSLSNYEQFISSENSFDNLNRIVLVSDILKTDLNFSKLKPDEEKKLIYILNKYSRELKEDTDSSASNIKYFKSTAEEIFDNFRANIQDFECYKERFQEILSKDEDVTNMKDFIKDIVQNITSKENVFNIAADKSINSSCYDNIKSFNSNSSTYTISSTGNSKSKSSRISPESIKASSLKLDNRNVQVSSRNSKPSKVKSTGEFDKTLYKLPIKVSGRRNIEIDKEIPIKSTCAKTSLLLNDDDIKMCDVTTQMNKESDTSLIYKFCSYFCKMFRKNN